MLNIRKLWAATCTHVPGGIGASMGSGMSTFALAGVAVRKPAAADARYGAQGASPAWSPPV